MLQSMTIATADAMHVDAILDSGATASIFPLNYHNLSKICKYPTPSHAIMADSSSKLTLYGTAMYGSIPVIVGDIQRPLISEGALTGPPNNLTILKTGTTAWILDPDKTPDDPNWILCHCTKESDNLYHLQNISRLHTWRPTVSVSYGIIEQQTTKSKGNRRISHNQSNGNLNPLEVLHVILGHIPESTIKRIVKNNLVNGLKVSYEQIKNLKLGICPTCMMTKMKAFPIYPTMEPASYGVFECLSLDGMRTPIFRV